jgi:hypothetical protein
LVWAGSMGLARLGDTERQESGEHRIATVRLKIHG